MGGETKLLLKAPLWWSLGSDGNCIPRFCLNQELGNLEFWEVFFDLLEQCPNVIRWRTGIGLKRFFLAVFNVSTLAWNAYGFQQFSKLSCCHFGIFNHSCF